MGGFVWNNGSPQVMQTYTPEQLPVLNGLAKEFAISDAWFCSMPSGHRRQPRLRAHRLGACWS